MGLDCIRKDVLQFVAHVGLSRCRGARNLKDMNYPSLCTRTNAAGPNFEAVAIGEALVPLHNGRVGDGLHDKTADNMI
jgi:hypothetical protein